MAIFPDDHGKCALMLVGWWEVFTFCFLLRTYQTYNDVLAYWIYTDEVLRERNRGKSGDKQQLSLL